MSIEMFSEGVHTCGVGVAGIDKSKVRIDQACLHLINTDPVNSLEFWAQSEECYKCSSWHYATIPAKSSSFLVVNSTYPTYVTVGNEKLNYTRLHHFQEFSNSSMKFNSSGIQEIDIITGGHNSFYGVVIAFLVLACLAIIYSCSKSLLKRMDSDNIEEEDDEDDLLDNPRQRRGLTYSQLFEDSNLNTTNEANITLSATTTLHTLPSSSSRLKSLDAFRGLAITLMIFVNYGGGKYYYFKHARWNGLTVADLVFPWFLWIMGVALVFSVKSQLRKDIPRPKMLLNVLRRSAILFSFGLIINSIGHNYFPTFRIMGVLQRFAFCYLINATIEVIFAKNDDNSQEVGNLTDILTSLPQWVITLGLVAVQLGITFGLKVPGCPKGYLGPGGVHEYGKYMNCTGGAAGYVDRMILGEAHVYQKPTCALIYDSHVPYDPEGILGIFTSCLMVQMGVAAGRIISLYRSHKSRITRWMLWALWTGLFSGFLCGWSKEDGVIPVNKNLWSVSFVLTTSSFAFLLFSLMYIVIDVIKKWEGSPFSFVGMNSILLYMGHEICAKLLPWSWAPAGTYHYQQLCMNIWGAGLWVATAYCLHSKRLYFSI